MPYIGVRLKDAIAGLGRRGIRFHGLLAAALLLAGCATFTPVEMTSRDARYGQGSEIGGVRVLRETSHLLAVEVDYVYDGSLGSCAYIGVRTTCSDAGVCRDEPQGWAYVPAQLLRGHHRARVLVSMNSEGPEAYVSDQLHIDFYAPGKSTFLQATAPFEKHWQRTSIVPEWANNWCRIDRRKPSLREACK